MGENMRLHLSAALVALVTVFSALGLAAASASAASRTVPRFASEATADQNKVIEGALARVPGGTRISASEVKWPGGTVLGVPASPDQNNLQKCLDTYPSDFCGFAEPGYEGTYIVINQTGASTWVKWGALIDDQGMYSWFNNTTARVWREQFVNHGNELCIDPTPYGNFTESDYTGPDLNDYWILLSTNGNQC
jgi:hypothetical protein